LQFFFRNQHILPIRREVVFLILRLDKILVFYDKLRIKGKEMKKILFIVMSIVLVSGLYGDAFKIMGGLNLSKYTTSLEKEGCKLSYKIGFCMGGGLEIDLNENIAIEVDCFFIQKGSKIELPDFPGLKSNFKLGTICLPVLAKVKFKRDSIFYILGGGGFSIISSHKFEINTGEEVEQVDWKDYTKGLDFGLVFGCGAEMKISEYQDFFIEGRYHHGFVNILKEIDESIKTHTILLILGIKTY